MTLASPKRRPRGGGFGALTGRRIRILAALAAAGCEAPPLRPALDAGAVTDAAPADAAPTDAALPAFCAKQSEGAAFCADFDEGDLLAAFEPSVFPNPSLAGGGAVEADEVLASSRPRSVRFVVPAVLASEGRTASALVGRDFALLPRYLLVDATFRIDTELFTDDRGEVEIFAVDLGDRGGIRVVRHRAGLSLVVVERRLAEAPIEERVAFSESVPVGEWRRLSVVFRDYPLVDGDAGGVSAIVGGLAAKVRTPTSFQDAVGHPFRIRLGVIEARGPTGAFRVNFDDVRLWLFDDAP